MSLLSTISGLSESKQQSDTPVPPEILTVVESLKKHMAEQKKIRDEFNVSSVKPLEDLTTELHELQRSVTTVLSGLRRQSVQTLHMSDEVLKLERNSSMVQRTLDMTYNLSQTSPEITEYFKGSISSFGARVQSYKQEVQEIEDLFSSRAKASLTPRELAEVLRKLDDQFMSLAAQLYTLNEELNSAKHHYLRQHRTLDGKHPAVFQASASKSPIDLLMSMDAADKSISGKTPYGPSPFATAAVGMSSGPGATATPSLGTAFGLQTPAPAAAVATTTSSTGFSFGSFKPPSASGAPAPGLSLGAPMAATGGGFSFGAAASSAAGAIGGGTTAWPGFGVGSMTSTAPSTGFGFGTAALSQAPVSSSIGGGFSFGGLGGAAANAASTGTTSLFGSNLFGPK